MSDDRVALLWRAAYLLRECSGHDECDDIADGVEALAAELEAAPPPAPWVDAPDGPGEWEGGEPREDAEDLHVCEGALSLLVARPGASWSIGLPAWLAAHPDWRYRRRQPVTVPEAP